MRLWDEVAISQLLLTEFGLEGNLRTKKHTRFSGYILMKFMNNLVVILENNTRLQG